MKIEFEYKNLSGLYRDTRKLQNAAILTDNEGLIQFMNPAFIELSGYEAQESMEFGTFFLSPENKPSELLTNAEITILECLLWRNNGSLLPVTVSKQEIKTGKNIFYLILVNPTVSLQSERTGHFDFLFENIEDGLVLHDLRGNILRVNQSLAENLDYEIKELLQTNFSELCHTGSPGEISRKSELLKKHRSFLYLSNLISKSGRIRPVEIQSKLMNYEGKETVLSVIRDISGRSLIENRLIEDKNAALHSESELRAVFDNVPSLILLFDKEYRIIRINSRALHCFGISKEEALQKNIYDVIGYLNRELNKDSIREINFDSIDELNRLLYNTVVKNEETIRKEISFRYNSEDPKDTTTYLISTSRVDKPGDQLYLACIDDISERKQMEMDLIDAKERAEESERLKSIFLENISHEIRTPLNGLLGFASFLMRDTLSNEKKKQFIEIINKSGKRLVHTIDKIVEMSKLKSGAIRVDPEKIELIAELENFIHLHNHDFQRDNVLFIKNYDIQPSDFVVETDKVKLLQIINYLLDNAFKYTKVGFVELNVCLVKDNILFSIKDTGVGIADADKENIFKAFRQGAEKQDFLNEGNGLGLTIAKTLVEKLGGRLWFESTLNKGTCFYFTLPYLSTKKTLEKNGKRKKDIEIIVAEPDNGEFSKIRKILKEKKVESFQVRNGDELLNRVREKEAAKVVILNSGFLRKNGNKNDILKLKKNKLPVLIIADEGVKPDELPAGSKLQVLTRPFEPEELISTLNNLLHI